MKKRQGSVLGPARSNGSKGAPNKLWRESLRSPSLNEPPLLETTREALSPLFLTRRSVARAEPKKRICRASERVHALLTENLTRLRQGRPPRRERRAE